MKKKQEGEKLKKSIGGRERKLQTKHSGLQHGLGWSKYTCINFSIHALVICQAHPSSSSAEMNEA